ncbi:MAG: methionine--tRNA ligase subunit beta [Candidatus Omnitrophota bacterium]|nr:MAG: methionine--tRNA ligase subunit beta [Candidatus Omnitrophota bacterium]
MLKFEDFKKMDIRIATIVEAEKVSGADKLLKLIVDLGEEKRQLIAGIALQYEAQDVIGKQVPVLCNLEPAKIRGVESNGMVLCATAPDPVLLSPLKKVPAGSKIR